MRYLSSISLALVVLMALACTATPAATPTPTGPMYSEEEAIAMLKEHLQTKMYQGQGRQYPCLIVIEDSIRNPNSVTWDASYDERSRLWNVTARKEVKSTTPSATSIWGKLTDSSKPSIKMYAWSVYERTGSIMATGDDPLNQFC